MISLTIQLSVVVGVVASIVSTLPSSHYTPETCSNPACNNDAVLCNGYMICQPLPRKAFDDIQIAVFYVLLLDYVARVALVAFIPPR